MITPTEMYAEAQTNLNDISNVMANGANIAPDYVMRTVIAMRSRLARHKLADVDENHYAYGTCAVDSQRWPCVEIQEDLKVLAVQVDDEG